MPIRAMKIFKAGDHINAAGAPMSFTDRHIRETAEAYNLNERHQAPLVLGHPTDDTKSERFGWVRALAASGGALYAVTDVREELVDLVRRGAYKFVSAAFHTPDAYNNPVRGTYFLRHVALLGATPPAIKGLGALEFSEASHRFAAASNSYCEGISGALMAAHDVPGLCYSGRESLARCVAARL